MPTPRQYQFDVDTKRYLNRVNTYRALNGLPDIQKSDAADIDNFVIGLKDLGIYDNSVIWLLGGRYNVGNTSLVLDLGKGNSIGTLMNSPTINSNSISFVAGSNQYMFCNNVGIRNDTLNGCTLFTAFKGNAATPSDATVNTWCDSGGITVTGGMWHQRTTTNMRSQFITVGNLYSAFSDVAVNMTLPNWNSICSVFSTGRLVRSIGNNLAQNNGTGGAITTNPILSRYAVGARAAAGGTWTTGGTFGFTGEVAVSIGFGLAERAFASFSIIKTLINTTIGKGLNLP